MNPNHSSAAGNVTLDRLNHLRASLRRRLLAYGVCVVGAGGIVALLAVVALDWALHLPGGLRLVMTAGFVTGGAVAIVYWVVRPLRAPLTLLDVARFLERRFPYLSDRISSAVSFVTEESGGSLLMRDQVVRNTDAIMRKLPTGQLLSSRRVYAGFAVLTASAIAFSSVMTGDSDWLRFGVSRYLHPFGDLRWPNRVEIVPLTGDRFVASGDALALKMRIVRGDAARPRAIVRIQRTDGSTAALVMNRQDDGTYSCRIDSVSHPFRYWFEAGDDNTRERSGEVMLARPPYVVDISAEVHPPPYAPSGSIKTIDPTVGAVEAVAQSRIDITARFSKPVVAAEGSRNQPVILTDDERTVALRLGDDDPTVVKATIVARNDHRFRLRVVDRLGFENRSARWYAVRLREDEPPVVTIRNPTGALERTPNGIVRIAFDVRDDWGVQIADVQTALESKSATWKTYSPSVALSQSESESQRASGSIVLQLADLGAPVDSTVLWRIRAVDNSPDGGQVGLSATMRIHVIDAVELDRRNRSALVKLELDLRNARQSQREIADRTATLARSAQSDLPTDHAVLSGVAADQQQLSRDLRQILDGFERLADQATGDEDAADPWSDQAQQAARNISDIRRRHVESAARQLESLRRQMNANVIAEARANQDQAVEALSQTLNQLGNWSDFHQLVARTQNLLDRQQALRQNTGSHHQKTMGQSVERLTSQHRQALLQLSERQDELAQEAATLLQTMRSVGDALCAVDPATAAVLDDAMRAATATALVRSMRDAAYAISQNRSMTAAATQQQAENGLLQMQKALRERRERKLQHLARQLEKHERTVAAWINRQGRLISDNQDLLTTGADRAAFGRLASGQTRLEQNVRQAIRDWRGTEQLSVIQDALDRSIIAMHDAAKLLVHGGHPESIDHQNLAADALNIAHEQLLAMSQKARAEAMKLQVMAMRSQLEGIRNQQRETNTATEKLIAAAQTARRLNRKIARTASSLMRRQHALMKDATELKSKLQDASVYDFVLDRAIATMDQAVELLSERTLSMPLAEVQAEALSDLDLLVRALDDMLHMPPPDAYERGGGGGGGSNQDLPQVPPMAELLVLKSMQTALNDKTRANSRDMDSDQPTEASLKNIRRLAAEQARIFALTREVVDRAHDREN